MAKEIGVLRGFFGGGGNGLPSATTVVAEARGFFGGGGNGLPSAARMAAEARAFFGADGRSRVPSAWVDPL
jgi:hypothetical protein